MQLILALVRPYLVQIAVVGALAVSAGGGFLALKVHYTNVGFAEAINKIAAEDKETVDAANEARGRVRACYAAGRLWDASEGQCQGQ